MAQQIDGERIRALRLARGMTQEKLARMARVDIKTIWRAEREAGPLRPETVLDIASALEVGIGELARPADRRRAVGGDGEGHGNLVLRRVERAFTFYQMAERCEAYSWSFDLEPDADTAELMAELMTIARRAVDPGGSERDAFDARGEFSAPARVARLAELLDRLRDRDVSVLSNRFIHHADGAARTVLRVLFAPGDVERRKEFTDFMEGAEPMERKSRQIEGVRKLDFRRAMSSVMGALELALETIGDPYPYAFLMGASGCAFRLQIAHPAWCPSAPYAGVGFRCVDGAARAVGRTLDWIGPDPRSPDPMATRRSAIVESIDRGVPVLYGAEECGLIVGYHGRDAGAQFSLRTYFDATEVYRVLDRLHWPMPGIVGPKEAPPARLDVLREARALAVRLAFCEEEFPSHVPGRRYLCGFRAYEAWCEGLRDTERFDVDATALAVPIQANSWCLDSLIDARRAAADFLRSFVDETSSDVAAHLSSLAERYEAIVALLAEVRPAVPRPEVEESADGVALAYRLEAGGGWPAQAREAQADALHRALSIEREVVAELDQVAL